MKNFALIGVAGYVAPRHLRAIHDTQLEDEWKPAVIHSVKLLLAPPTAGTGK